MLLFGTIELGLMAKESASLNHFARESARVAATGATISRIQAHLADVASGLDADRMTTSIDYRAWDEATGTWGSWTTLSDDGSQNLAYTGDQIRVHLEYSYELATGRLLANTLNASEDNTVTIDATIVSMRE